MHDHPDEMLSCVDGKNRERPVLNRSHVFRDSGETGERGRFRVFSGTYPKNPKWRTNTGYYGQVTWYGILYGGSDILGACGYPDYLESRHDNGRIVVPVTMVFIGYDESGSGICGGTKNTGMVNDN